MAPSRLEVVVPSFFRCPISLDLMTDPVSLCTGMTYDRASIEKWLDDGNVTCPATMQVLANSELVPNHTLRRLIQDWCVANRSKGVERIPTPRPPATPATLRPLLEDAASSFPGPRLEALRKLRLLFKDSDKNRRCILEAGLVPLLTSLLPRLDPAGKREVEACQEVLGLLALVPASSISDVQRRAMAGAKHLSVVAWVLHFGGLEARVNAAAALEHVLQADALKLAVGSTEGVMRGLVRLLQEDQLYARAVKSSLRCLLAVCTAKANRVKAVEAGAVPVLVELLLQSSGSAIRESSFRAGNAECALAVLELLCSCAEGRAAVNAHAMAVPALVTSLLSVSEAATECAVGALWSVCQFSPEYVNNNVVGDALELAVEAGLFTKLILLMQADFSSVTKTKAAALMRLLGEIWRNSPCSADHGLTHIRPY